MTELNLEKLRNKLENLKNPKNKKFTRATWKPKKDGEKSVIRLIKYPWGEDPFVELFFHYGIGKGTSILCPRQNYGRDCPICEFAQSQDAESARPLWPKQRIFAVTVDREDPKLTPKYWGFGKQVYQKLIESLLDNDYSNYLDLNRGIDMIVSTSQPKGQSFPKTDFTFRRKDSPLADSDEDIQNILNSIKKIDEVFKPLTTAEIKQRLSEWLSFDEGEAEKESSETVKGDSEAEKDLNELMSESGNVEDIDEEFEKALAGN
jgi:hypothetical protein